MVSITQLPEELLLIIFSLCSDTDLLDSVQHVCKVWRDLARCHQIWQHRTVVIPRNQSAPTLKKRLRSFPFVRGLFLQQYYPQCVLSMIHDVCPGLYRFRFWCIDHVLFDVSLFMNLYYLDIVFQFEKGSLEDRVRRYVSDFPPLLRTVIFRRCFTDGGVPIILFQKCLYMKHVVVSPEYELDEFVDKSVQSSIHHCKMAPGKQNIQTVYLCGFALPGQGILEAISEFPNLNHLALRQNLFNHDEILKCFFNQPLLNLTFLDISYSYNLHSRVVFAIAVTCPNLISLSLRRCYVGDTELFAVISCLNKLQQLNLHGTDVTSLHFDLIPLKLPNLTDLNLCACRKINEVTMTKLVKAMPNLIIVHPRSGFIRGSNATGRKPHLLEQRNAI